MGNWFRSYLKFTDGALPVLTQKTVSAELAWHFISRRSFGIGAGTVLGGTFSDHDISLFLKYGPVVSFRYSRILMTEYFPIPFIVAGVSGSFSWTAAEETHAGRNSFFASDVRLSVTSGYTFWNRLQVYLSPKVFGGPVIRVTDSNRVRGSDRYFFQAGMGMTVILPGEIMIFVNGSPLGEQVLGGGLSKVF
ncbi:MAG: hypothetical protein JW863_06120 [Chitinispirillaceae bacterium]|nr:hypothetical protein [Chitinispirillaceae bacterium]